MPRVGSACKVHKVSGVLFFILFDAIASGKISTTTHPPPPSLPLRCPLSSYQSLRGVPPEEGFARLARDGVEVVAERAVAAHAADLVLLVFASASGAARPGAERAERGVAAHQAVRGVVEVHRVDLHLDAGVHVVRQVPTHLVPQVNSCKQREKEITRGSRQRYLCPTAKKAISSIVQTMK